MYQSIEYLIQQNYEEQSIVNLLNSWLIRFVNNHIIIYTFGQICLFIFIDHKIVMVSTHKN